MEKVILFRLRSINFLSLFNLQQPMSDESNDEHISASGSAIKVIILGDSAVGKTKLMERFLLDKFHKQQLSTYALTIFPYTAHLQDVGEVKVEFWDTAGQDIFEEIHQSYYYGAHSCILCFDVTRKITYTNMQKWWDELQKYSPNIPSVVVANKIDVDPSATTKEFAFAKKHGLPLYYCSASTGVNVVKLFTDAINLGYRTMKNPTDPFMGELMRLLEENRSANPDLLPRPAPSPQTYSISMSPSFPSTPTPTNSIDSADSSTFTSSSSTPSESSTFSSEFQKTSEAQKHPITASISQSTRSSLPSSASPDNTSTVRQAPPPPPPPPKKKY
ncbi:Rabl2, Ras superfamily GTPase [Monocercomonoides exilis]|uniref:RABL2 n=1 Tax=Monocercomonoides exilis TaxID=2049356 RepID=A0A125SEA5_9EUKA|nr:RABL2 [Monocercomonoides exilis]KAH7815238.1 Rabl2, Ras superfamily GTPase [Monocercomonoides exilis]|eukprot:MONOS_4470.1-p1 / transcript=MONOS_4470.1 / gene=MONOS_4470 / organism=Monocercomonoides_exilis_PA203 / gene_product=Rabl2, Ras superfamily GTPase / transcript_product=Rabl2, Ras superfamily GTPase / location=Mono_scaffold00119:41098-42621(+) / protein_length=331 / sequence_SO=supercontig / SO=protein_coding / is_pseudo=false